MLTTRLFGLVLVIVIAAAGVSAYTLGLGSTPGTSQGTTSTTTVSTTCTSTQSETTSPVEGSFISSSSYPIRVDNVSALVYQGAGGNRSVQFQVGFTNVGPGSVYMVRGCGSSLNSTVAEGNGVIQKTTGLPRCLCASAPSEVAPGSSGIQLDPGCWSGYAYNLVGHGTFTVKLVLSWGTPNYYTNGTTITATFTLY